MPHLHTPVAIWPSSFSLIDLPVPLPYHQGAQYSPYTSPLRSVVNPPKAVPVVEIEEGFFFFQALSNQAGLADFVGALHAPDRSGELSADDAPLGLLRRRVVRVSLLPLPLDLCKREIHHMQTRAIKKGYITLWSFDLAAPRAH